MFLPNGRSAPSCVAVEPWNWRMNSKNPAYVASIDAGKNVLYQVTGIDSEVNYLLGILNIIWNEDENDYIFLEE